MKTFFLISVFILLITCTDNYPPKNYNYTIFNSSTKIVEIIPFDLNNNKLINSKITILPNLNHLVSYKDTAPYTGFELYRRLFPFIISKVEIVFNNEKKVLFSKCNLGEACEERNILNYKNDILQFYIITDDDYTAATDCGGNCN